LNRDPAAITSLSVACRYASRPPSDPTNPLPFKSLAPSQALSLFARFFIYPTFTGLFWAFRCRRAATNCQRDAQRVSLVGNTKRCARASFRQKLSHGGWRFPSLWHIWADVLTQACTYI